ncbi:DUF3971 domain-containing protein [Bosea sp. BK604]|uniref:YhdP family protein n=1 Tax=Bosea sp. BK604 TaxID=2512180 RepID=UPI0010513D82|nr:DUF3971 domain-containing protein [Bosea sp. BK604]TCR66493.1 uncharacterized protein DUF3971 [Bosea sp. BK604]
MNDTADKSGQAKAATPACEEVAAVARRAKAGLVTIAVAAVVALVTLAAAAGTLLVTGMIPLSGLEGRISAAIAERLGPDWQVEAGQAELSRIDGRSQLMVKQVSFRHRSGAAFRAPEAVLGYEPLALLRGEIRLVSVDLRGVNVRLGVNHDGALIVNADSAPPETLPQPVVADAGHWNAFTSIMSAVGTLAQGDGLLGALETAGMRGARLALVDPDGRQKAGLEDVDIRLSRAEGGVTRLTMKGRTGPRWKELSIDLSTDKDGTHHAEVDITRFEPAEAMALAFGTASVAIDGLPMKGKVSLAQKPGGPGKIEARFDILPGTVHFRDSPIEPIKIESAHVEVESNGGLNDFRIVSTEVNAGLTQLRGTGRLSEQNGVWQAALDVSGQVAGLDSDPPVVIDRMHGDLTLDQRVGEVRIPNVTVQGPAIHAEMTALVRREGDSPYQKFLIKSTDSDARAILAIWPGWTSPELHGTLRRQLLAGRMKSVVVDLDLPAADHARMLKGAGMPDKSLSVSLDGTQVRFQPGPGLPPLVDADVKGTTSGRIVTLSIPKATADLGNGRKLMLSEGSFNLPEIWMHRAPAQVGFRTTGPMEALAALFAFPALKDFTPGALDPASLRGTSDLKTALTLPLAPDVKANEVTVQSAGTFSNVGSDSLLAPEKLDGANLAVTFDANGLSLRGDGRVSGDKAQIDVRQNAKGQGEANLSFVLDNAARQRRGFGPEAGITGSVPVKVSKPLGRGADQPPRVELDLTRAAIESSVPGFTKAAGKAGKVSFNFIADNDGPDLDDFTFDAAPVLIKGKIELGRQNSFESASLSQVRVSPGDNLKVEARRDGSLTKLTVRGAVADVRPFVKDLQGGPAPSQRREKNPAKEADIDIDLDVPILTGFNNEAIGNGKMRLSKRDGDLRSLSFDGRIGKATVSARKGDTAAPLVVQSENGGAVLRFFDFYRRAHGGDLILTLGPGENRQSGELLFRDFVVRDEPALKRVIGEQTNLAMAGDAPGGVATPRINANEAAFTKLRAEFSRSSSRLDVSDMVIWGQQVGFTLQGNVDYGRDKVDIAGTFVPGYAFNNAFAQVPVVGALLGGGSQYGGLFAVNFRISGSASAPTMSINPLSAIAPGILRRFVDPLGGTPNERPVQGPRTLGSAEAQR